jgi:adenylate cyclase
MDVREAARRLDARTLVEGSVRKAAGRLRITAQLVSGIDGYQVWSETYEREASEPFAIQREVGRSVADAIERRCDHRMAG